jgi:hypothetical protein
MSLTQNIKRLLNTNVESGAIRYVGLPLAAVVLVDGAPGAWSQLFAAAGAPSATLPCWLCGFQSYATNVAADVVWQVDVGYGGIDGAAVAASVVLLTGYPISVAAQAVALGPTTSPTHMLPYPVRIPPAQRMAARILNTVTGAGNITEFRVILATGL